MSYPEIKSVVLDASFDDLLPLALKVMPDSWSESNRDLDRCRPAAVQPLKCRPCLLGPLVQHTVRQYMNLNNADQLLKWVWQEVTAHVAGSDVCGLDNHAIVMMNKVSSLPAGTRGRSCSSGEPEMRSSPQRKYFTAHLESCRGRKEVADGQKHRLEEPVVFAQSHLTY